MKLRVYPINLSAGKPIAFINAKDAAREDIHVGDRINIIYNAHRLLAVVDITNIVRSGYIALSQELSSLLPKKTIKEVSISIPHMALGSKVIQKRIQCTPYTDGELKEIIKDIVENRLSEAEIAYFVSGVYHCGFSTRETLGLIKAMIQTGQVLKWNSNQVADKHSIGGIPGNRTTPIIVSICASAGILMPKTSSRAITSAAGTADVMETLCSVDLSIKEIKNIVKKTNACLAWGGSLGLAPADDKLIQIEKKLNVDPEPQLIASILSKKLSVGSKYVLIDIPYGKGAKVSLSGALKLKHKFLMFGKLLKLKIKVILTNGSQPIGNGIGPVLEMRDILHVLRRENSPLDLEKKSLLLAGSLLEMMHKAPKGKGIKKAKEILDSGKAFDKFKEIIQAQRGEIKPLALASYKKDFLSPRAGKIKEINNKIINTVARTAGCPQDKAAGIYLHKHVGNKVAKNEIIATIYSESRQKLDEAFEMISKEPAIELA